MQNIFKFLVIIGLTLAGWSFSTGTARSAQPITVFVSVAPQKYFAQQICGPLAEITVMVAPGANPATYEPTPSQMVALSRARLYFAVGVPFERAWLGRIVSANPNMQIVHTDRGIQKIFMARHEHGGHDDADAHPDGGHGRQGIPDPHIWLSPPLVKIQARHMLEALLAADPSHAAVYNENYNRFAGQLDALDRQIASILEPARGRSFMVFHPSWGYFARQYGLVQIPIEMEGKEPTPSRLQHLIEQARRLNIQAVFVQPQFSDKSARMIAGAIDARLIKADPLALDWADNLKRQAIAFREALEG